MKVVTKVTPPCRRYNRHEFNMSITVFEKGSKMNRRMYLEKTASSVASLDRNELTRRIRGFKGRFKLDFTSDYLQKQSVDRLRHILLAARISSKPHN